MQEHAIGSQQDTSQTNNPLETDPLFTVDEVAAYLKLKPNTVRAMARTGELPAIKMNRVWRFQKSQIDHFIKDHISNID